MQYSINRKAQATLTFLLIIICLSALAYSFMVTDTFKTMDDKASIVNNELIKDTSKFSELFQSSYFGKKAYWRPLVFVSYMLEHKLFGLNPFYYYLTNIGIHIFTSLVVFFLIRLFFNEKWIPFLVALLFATHPIHWEAVSNIPGRSILLSSFFYVLSFYIFCLFRREKKGVGVLILSLVSFVGGLLCKESSMMLPVLILAYLYFLERPAGRAGASYLFISIPYFVILGCYLVIRRLLGMVSLFYPMTLKDSFFGLLSFLRSVITHFRTFLFPYDLHFDRSQEIFSSFVDIELILTGVFFLIVLALIIKQRKKLSAYVFFFICWFFIDLLPVSQFIVSIGTQAGRISTAEHFLYTASIGIFVIIVLSAKWIYDQNRHREIISAEVLKFVFLGIYVFYFLITVQQNITSASELAMLKQSLRYNPDNVRMIESYGYALVSAKQFEEGEKFFRKVLEHNPQHVRARISLGKALCDQGKCVEGLLEYEKIRDGRDLTDILERNKKATYSVVTKKFEDMLKKEPNNARVYFSLGFVYSKTNRLQESIAAYERALALKPDFKEALFNLANVHDGLGNKEKAKIYYEQTLNHPEKNEELDAYAATRLKALP